MRALLLFLLSSSIFLSYTQTVEDSKNIASDYCHSIVDSLKQAGYFRNALQINLNEVPTKANVAVYSVSGCLVSVHNRYEFLYSDGIGYILYSRRGLQDKYLKFSEPSILFDLFSVLNKNYLADSTLLIKNPYHKYSSDEGGMSIYLNIEFPNGTIINKQLTFPWSSYAYCTQRYFENFYQYLKNLQNLTFKHLDYGIAYYLSENFTTEISRQFVIDCDYTFPRMAPLPPFFDEKIEIIHKY